MPKKHWKLDELLQQEHIETFLSSLAREGKSQNTIRSYASDLRGFREFVKETPALIFLQDAAQEWLSYSKNKCAPQTTLRRAASLRSFAFHCNVDLDLSRQALPKKVPPAAHPLIEGAVSVEKMLNACTNDRDRMLVALGAYAGLRVSETLNVRASWIDRATNELVVIGKGVKTRRIPISKRLWSLIGKGYIASKFENDKPFISLSERQARNVITNIAHRAGIPYRVSSHDLRATFGTMVLNKTGNVRIVQELLGHANVATTQAYLGVTKEQLRDAVEL